MWITLRALRRDGEVRRQDQAVHRGTPALRRRASAAAIRTRCGSTPRAATCGGPTPLAGSRRRLDRHQDLRGQGSTSCPTPTRSGGGGASGESAGVTPYGISIAPDGKVWYTKLNGERVGRVDPSKPDGDPLQIVEWAPPVTGPRRLEVAPDGWSGCRVGPAATSRRSTRRPRSGRSTSCPTARTRCRTR